MTLRDQIREIHAYRFSPEFHAHRGSNVPAMVKDLIEKVFDDLALEHTGSIRDPVSYWSVPDSVEIRAIRMAWSLIQSIGLRDCTPAVK